MTKSEFRAVLEAAAKVCEQIFNDERNAGDVEEAFPDNAWSRICAKNIIALTPEQAGITLTKGVVELSTLAESTEYILKEILKRGPNKEAVRIAQMAARLPSGQGHYQIKVLAKEILRLRVRATPALCQLARAQQCPRPQVMGEHACKDRTQCWEPCGDLGHHEEYARQKVEGK